MFTTASQTDTVVNRNLSVGTQTHSSFGSTKFLAPTNTFDFTDFECFYDSLFASEESSQNNWLFAL